MNRSRLLIKVPVLTATLLLLGQTPLLAQEGEPTEPTDADPAPAAADSAPAAAEPTPAATDPAPADADSGPAAAATPAVTVTDLHEMLTGQQSRLEDQQSQLEGQQRQLEEQQQLIATLQGRATTELEAARDTIAEQEQQIREQRQDMASMQTQIDQISQRRAEELSEEELAFRARLDTVESSIAASQDAANTAFDEESFPNSTMIPGTNAAMRVGGYVKMNIVETFDPLDSLDRFIAGSIPVPQESTTPRTTMTVSQSRLNYELRDRTEFGTMRAYVEGDFAGDGDTFRLRHAFGQFRELLAGKTWSVFQDIEAVPEDLDFEGINGAVNVRQPQLRYSPQFGEDWNMMFSLEDPNPEVTGGEATSQWPDLVASVRRTWLDRWHIRSSAVLRQITAIWDGNPTGDTSQALGWGISLSGRTATHVWNTSGQDNFMFQVNVGEGIGRYINDLNTVGGADAKFDSSGNLETLPVTAGYLAYQHWWRGNRRSTINLSWVDVDNLSFEADDAYQETFRGAVNYIWSPTPRIDIGGEIIYGSRKNKNGERATATQIQLSSKYRF